MTRRSSGWKRVRLNATDLLFSKVVRTRDGFRCQWPGCPRAAPHWQIDAAHILSRRYKQTRWLLSNALSLCKVHHDWAGRHETEWYAYCVSKIGPREYDRLLLLAKGPAGRKPDEVIVRQMLRAELHRLESSRLEVGA